MQHATPRVSAAARATELRQKLLFLYLANGDLHSPVVAWSTFDGSTSDRPEMDNPDPPYATALAAMRDGWRVLQVSPLKAPPEGQEFAVDYLKHEVILEQLVEPRGEVTP